MDIQSVLTTTTSVVLLIAGVIYIGERTPKLVVLAKWLYYKPKVEILNADLKQTTEMVEMLADLHWEEKYKVVATKFAAARPEIQQYEEMFLAQIRRDFKCFIVGVSTVQLRERLQQVVEKAAPKYLREEHQEHLEAVREDINGHRENLIQCGINVDELEKEFANA